MLVTQQVSLTNPGGDANPSMTLRKADKDGKIKISS